MRLQTSSQSAKGASATRTAPARQRQTAAPRCSNVASRIACAVWSGSGAVWSHAAALPRPFWWGRACRRTRAPGPACVDQRGQDRGEAHQPEGDAGAAIGQLGLPVCAPVERGRGDKCPKLQQADETGQKEAEAGEPRHEIERGGADQDEALLAVIAGRLQEPAGDRDGGPVRRGIGQRQQDVEEPEQRGGLEVTGNGRRKTATATAKAEKTATAKAEKTATAPATATARAASSITGRAASDRKPARPVSIAILFSPHKAAGVEYRAYAQKMSAMAARSSRVRQARARRGQIPATSAKRGSAPTCVCPVATYATSAALKG